MAVLARSSSLRRLGCWPVAGFEDFDRYCEEHNVQPREYGEAFARWLGEQAPDEIA